MSVIEANNKFDEPWKIVIENFFKEFLAFFFEDTHRIIDWKRGYEFKDKEFQKIIFQPQIKKL